MSKNLNTTKRKLTILFSIIVFISFFILGTTFFSIKYFKEQNFEKSQMKNIIILLKNQEITIDEIMNSGKRFENVMFDRKGRKEEFRPKSEENRLYKPRGFLNFLLIDNSGSLISSNIKDDISEDLILSIIEDDGFLELSFEDGFLIKKFRKNERAESFILIKKVEYSFSSYLSDVLGFLLFNVIFSLVIYFIGYKFVNKTFIPVEENMKDMKSFIHNAGHELKTPISVIDSNIQLIDDIKEYDAEMTKELKQEVVRLNSIIDSLIKLSNLGIDNESENVNIKDTIDSALKDFGFKIKEKKLKIKVDISNKESINVNKNYFHIFISNLIGNAIKYNKDNGKIHISYKENELVIKDSGIGIDKKDIDKIFDRFFKGDKSRNTDGFGIGLSLVKKISDIYGWKIQVGSDKGKGTKFITKF